MERPEISVDQVWGIACRIAQRQPRWIREDARQAACVAGLEALEEGCYGSIVFLRMARAALREKRMMERPVPRGDMEDTRIPTGDTRDFILDLTDDEREFVDACHEFGSLGLAAERLGWTLYKARGVRAKLAEKWEA